MPTPLFIATESFGPSDGERWTHHFEWARIPALVEVVSLDTLPCPRLIARPEAEDGHHIVCEDFRLDYHFHLDDVQQRVAGVGQRNILGLYRNPEAHVASAPGPGDLVFCGCDLIEEQTQVSALTNCGGFSEAFPNDELNRFGLPAGFDRAREVRHLLAERYPREPHAQCEMYALWRLAGDQPCASTDDAQTMSVDRLNASHGPSSVG